MGKAAFLWRTLYKYACLQSPKCPFCEGERTQVIGRKHVVLQLRRCNACALKFRYPTDKASEAAQYYQKRYRQENVTDLPPEEEIPRHIADRFRDSGRDLAPCLRMIREIGALEPGGRVLDYGCSWGYGVHQLKEAGFRAVGFEISKPRVEYGKRVLKVDLTSDVSALPSNSFDLVYSSHVLEHIPDPKASFLHFQRLLKPSGKLLLYVPNCGGRDARKLGVKWGQMINEKHLLALTAEFFQRNLPAYGFRIMFASSPYNELPRPLAEGPDLEGEELLVVATPDC